MLGDAAVPEPARGARAEDLAPPARAGAAVAARSPLLTRSEGLTVRAAPAPAEPTRGAVRPAAVLVVALGAAPATLPVRAEVRDGVAAGAVVAGRLCAVRVVPDRGLSLKDVPALANGEGRYVV